MNEEFNRFLKAIANLNREVADNIIVNVSNPTAYAVALAGIKAHISKVQNQIAEFNFNLTTPQRQVLSNFFDEINYMVQNFVPVT